VNYEVVLVYVSDTLYMVRFAMVDSLESYIPVRIRRLQQCKCMEILDWSVHYVTKVCASVSINRRFFSPTLNCLLCCVVIVKFLSTFTNVCCCFANST